MSDVTKATVSEQIAYLHWLADRQRSIADEYDARAARLASEAKANEGNTALGVS